MFIIVQSVTKEFSLPNYLAGEKIVRFVPFPRELAQCEMQADSSKIWTGVAVSISQRRWSLPHERDFIIDHIDKD